MSNVRERLVRVISEVVDVPASEAAQVKDLKELKQWDSLLHLNTMLALEKEFGIVFEIGEIADLHSMDQMTGLVERKLG